MNDRTPPADPTRHLGDLPPPPLPSPPTMPRWPGPTVSLLPPPPPPPGVVHRPRWFAALGVAITGLLVVSAVALFTKTVDSGPAHPHEWDPRVADLAAFVEHTRGLTFDHPVYVDFLTPKEYTHSTTADAAEVANDDRAGLDRYAGELRALGVASGKLDLFAAYNAVSDGGTLAFYDPTDQRVKVRGTHLTIGLRVTLVHELTHALQDQHFDLERLYDPHLDSSASTAFRALIEGDALRVEEAYTSGKLTVAEQARYDKEYAGQLKDSIASTSDVPPFVSASFGVPYLLGQPFVVMVANKGGNAAVDKAFRSPPDTEEQLFDPTTFLAGEQAKTVDLHLAKGVTVLDDGPFGSPSWYLVLAERIDPKVAFDAALGWGGDAYTTFVRHGRTCIRVGFAGDTERDEKEMRIALDTWAAAMPGGRAKVVDLAGHPGLESCDPGPAIDMALTGRAEQALYLPSLWGYLVADAVSQIDVKRARCYAHGVIDGLTYAQITDPEGAALQGDDFQRLLAEAFQTCA
jgi:hypothetical protein